jgi:hypothetical protein
MMFRWLPPKQYDTLLTLSEGNFITNAGWDRYGFWTHSGEPLHTTVAWATIKSLDRKELIERTPLNISGLPAHRAGQFTDPRLRCWGITAKGRELVKTLSLLDHG